MCGITLKPFRKICKEFGAGLVFNQMVSAKALTMKDQKSLSMLSYDESERPVGMQLFGNHEDTLSEASKIIQDTGPDVIDLNLGCPAKKIVNDGGGSALLSDTDKLRRIFQKMRSSITGAFTVKIRAGWDEKSKNSLTVAKIAQEEGVDAIALHARTRAQGYSGKSDWDLITELKNTVHIPVIGNGDVITAQDAVSMIEKTGCDGVMTGRGAFSTPWIFDHFANNHMTPLTSLQIKDMIIRQYIEFRNHFGDDRGIKLMRKFICVYSKGLHGGSNLRRDIVRINDWPEIEDILNRFYQ